MVFYNDKRTERSAVLVIICVILKSNERIARVL